MISTRIGVAEAADDLEHTTKRGVRRAREGRKEGGGCTERGREGEGGGEMHIPLPEWDLPREDKGGLILTISHAYWQIKQ